MKGKGLLVMGDNPNVAIIKAFTCGSHYLVQEETIAGAFDRLGKEKFSWILIDLDFLREDEASSARSIATTWPDSRVFVMTRNEGFKAKNEGAIYAGIIGVPFNINEFVNELCGTAA